MIAFITFLVSIIITICSADYDPSKEPYESQIWFNNSKKPEDHGYAKKIKLNNLDNFAEKTFTLYTWLKIDSPDGVFWTNYDAHGRVQARLQFLEGKTIFEDHDGHNVTFSQAPEAEKWFQMIFVNNEGKLTLYLNGKKVSEEDLGHEDYQIAADGENIMGYRTKKGETLTSMHGCYTRLYIYRREVTEEEVTDSYENCKYPTIDPNTDDLWLKQIYETFNGCRVGPITIDRCLEKGCDNDDSTDSTDSTAQTTPGSTTEDDE